MQKEIKKLTDNEYEVKITLPDTDVKNETKKVAEVVGATVTVPGFRSGKAPADLVIRAVGESKIKDEVVKNLITPNLLSVLKEESLTPVINPVVENLDFDFEKPFSFTVKVVTYPEVVIAGYEKIKVKKSDGKEVTDTEVDEVVTNLYKQVENPPERENILVGSKGEKLTLGQKQEVAADDSFAKKMGATDLADLKKKIKDNLSTEAQIQAERDWETQILEALVEKTKVTIPQALIDAEVDNILRKIVYDLSSLQMSFEDYLKSQNKTVEELRKEYQDSATKTLTAQLALNELAKREKLEVPDDEVEQALPQETSEHAHSDSERTQMYSYLIQRKALAFLKDQGSR